MLEVALELRVIKLRHEEVAGSWRMTPLIHSWSRGRYLNPARPLYKVGRDLQCCLLMEMKCTGKHTGSRYVTHFFFFAFMKATYRFIFYVLSALHDLMRLQFQVMRCDL